MGFGRQLELRVSIGFLDGSGFKSHEGKRTLSDALFSFTEGDDNGQANAKNKAL